MVTHLLLAPAQAGAPTISAQPSGSRSAPGRGTCRSGRASTLTTACRGTPRPTAWVFDPWLFHEGRFIGENVAVGVAF